MKSVLHYFSISPDRSLHRERVFWVSILLPLGIGMGMIFSTLPCEYSLSWTAEGFVTFFELSKLPLTIAGLSLPLGTVSAVIHRSAQTAKQIKLSLELSRFKDFQEHRKAFIEEFSSLLDDNWSKIAVSHLYKVFFSQSIDRKYQPVIPDSWNSTYEMLTAFYQKIASEDYFSLSYWNALNNDLERKNLTEKKTNFVRSVANLLDQVVTSIEVDSAEMYIYERNGISDEDELAANLEGLAKDCAAMFSKLSVLATIFLNSHIYHFMSSDQVALLEFFARSEVYFKTEVTPDYDEFFGQIDPELINKVIYEDDQGRLINGNLVALTFRVKNVSDF